MLRIAFKSWKHEAKLEIKIRNNLSNTEPKLKNMVAY